MGGEWPILLLTAASIGFFHTLLGPDHYLPFIVMARARRWSAIKTTWITVLCGMGHVLSSVLLGTVGIAFGIAIGRLEMLESFRGGLAAWALIAFGLVYLAWGLRRSWRNRPHRHWHEHGDESGHAHGHVHAKQHVHVHEAQGTTSLVPWVLFTVFVFGPCEPLIPILMYPAAKSSLLGVAMVTLVFGTVTVGTMLGIVLISSMGVRFVPTKGLERYAHAIAGATILLCGVAIRFLGL